jgi:phenylalanyl-tRNA synthetase beta chain
VKIPLDWLKEYVEIKSTPVELAHRLTMAGLETELVTRASWAGVTVGRVARVEPHPNADRLTLVTVEGSGEPKTVVCGAPNVAAGQKVAYAAVGAQLIDGHSGKPTVLKPATIRGVESAGMVCSEKELGLSDEHEGILVLPDDAPVGAALGDYLGKTVLDTTPTPNRPDWFSLIGVAHEVAALEGARVRWPDDTYQASGETAEKLASVTIEDPDLCGRYVATVVRGVRIEPSPEWMQKRLSAAGLRPINNVVDITNYVMLELGQPLHAFDFDRLAGQAIVVRRARQDESLVTLDGVRRQLGTDMLTICDAERPLVIAGIFGGEDAEVNERTKNILLEAANFNPVSTRKTAAKVGLRTEASLRFEKGLSPAMPPLGARRATKLFVELCKGTAAPGIIDVYPGEQAATAVRVPRTRLNKVLGVEVEAERSRAVLEPLGFKVDAQEGELNVTPPLWRSDVLIADDVAEEIGRIVGYDELPTRTLSGAIPPFDPDEARDFREELRKALAAAGMQEVITYSMTHMAELQRVLPAGELEVRPPLRLHNPLSSEHELARTTLRASVLRTLSHNLRQASGPVAIFEVARTYLPNEDDLPEEREMAVGAVAGRTLNRWGREADPIDLFAAKSFLESAFAILSIAVEWDAATDHALLPGRTARITVGGERAGILGQVTPAIATAFEIDGDAFLFELEVAALHAGHPARVQARSINRYPTVNRDVALIVPESVTAAQIKAIVEQNRLVAGASVFDVYQGEGVPADKKSLAFAITFQAPDHTLTDEEVNRAERGIAERLKRELGAELRT